jgi:NAD(P)-dependent dehydrogenase (short-subunit alcohol dehydrogenase family)
VNVNKLFDLRGQTAIVTGGSAGLGLQMATGLAEAGADIVICARKYDRCLEAAGKIESLGVKVLPIKCDVTKTEEVADLVKNTINSLGKIDILVNNAGSVWGGSPEELKPENWVKVINVNIMGTVNVTQAVGREMIKKGKGNIINITSVTGFVGSDTATQNAIPYNTTKGALNTFTKDLAVKWIKHGIRVNGIAPGWFPTDMSSWQLSQYGEEMKKDIPMLRFGSDDELKGAVVFLASSSSSYVTGHILVVDGGFLAR